MAASGTIELTLTIPWAHMQQRIEEVITEAVANAEIKGFRKGKAPRKLVEEKLNKNDTISHAIQHALPKVYAAEVKAKNLKPILYPQIKIISGQESQDWVFSAVTCEAPVVTVSDYKKSFNRDQKLQDKLDIVLKNAQVSVPDLLIEEEASHRLAALVENLTQLGMTTDQYLKSKNLSVDQLKANIASEARLSLKLEFVLMEIQAQEKLENRQKTLDFLTALV